VLSGRGLCDELITRPKESYRLCCVVVCDLETSRMGAPYIYDISRLRFKVQTICGGKYPNLLLYCPLHSFLNMRLLLQSKIRTWKAEINRRCCNSAVFVAKENTELNKY